MLVAEAPAGAEARLTDEEPGRTSLPSLRRPRVICVAPIPLGYATPNRGGQAPRKLRRVYLIGRCDANSATPPPMATHTGSTRGRKSRKAIYSQLDGGVEELRNRLGGPPSPIEAQDIWGDIWSQEAHNSTAIEGNTLVLREFELLLKEGRAVGDKQLAEYLEVQGYAEAAQWVYQQGLAPGDWSTGDLITMTEVPTCPPTRHEQGVGDRSPPRRDGAGRSRVVPRAQYPPVSRGDAATRLA